MIEALKPPQLVAGSLAAFLVTLPVPDAGFAEAVGALAALFGGLWSVF